MVRRVWVLMLVLAAGCVTSTDMVQEKNDGVARRYPVTTDQAWEIAKTVFRWGGAQRLVEHRAEGYMLASDTDDAQAQGQGTVMAAWVERDPDGVARVTVRTRNRMLLNPTVLLTEEGFHERFARAARLVQEGKPLPAQPPD
jgi:hypothetical protein